MLKKLKKGIQSEFKRANASAFLFFLIFSTIIWLLVQFSKQYTEVLTVPIAYENYPKDKMIEKKGDDLEMRVQQTGFQIAWFKLFRPKLKVDLSNLPSDSTHLVYNLREHSNILEKKLPINFNQLEFLNNKLYIPFQNKSLKKVPVKSRIKIEYAPGYSSEEEIHFTPDSVKISGSQELIDTVSQVYTKAIDKKNVEENLTGKVNLDDRAGEIDLYRNTINYHLEVEKFTERELHVPLVVINAPKNMNIKLYPSGVDLRFKVSLKRYHQIKSIDFKIICDYNALTDHQKFFIPQIVEKPDVIKNVNVSPRKVQYIIKK